MIYDSLRMDFFVLIKNAIHSPFMDHVETLSFETCYNE